MWPNHQKNASSTEKFEIPGTKSCGFGRYLLNIFLGGVRDGRERLEDKNSPKVSSPPLDEFFGHLMAVEGA